MEGGAGLPTPPSFPTAPTASVAPQANAASFMGAPGALERGGLSRASEDGSLDSPASPVQGPGTRWGWVPKIHRKVFLCWMVFLEPSPWRGLYTASGVQTVPLSPSRFHRLSGWKYLQIKTFKHAKLPGLHRRVVIIAEVRVEGPGGGGLSHKPYGPSDCYFTPIPPLSFPPSRHVHP